MMMTPNETLEFKTRDPKTFADLLTGSAKPTIGIGGALFLPAAKPAGKVPLVIISIGSRGMTSGREELYSDVLTRAGIAVFIVDSYSGRGFTETVSDQGRMSFAASAADALHGLKRISEDSRFDPKRIGLMGYSRGGFVTVITYDRRLQEAVCGKGISFAGHVALYPSSYIQWRNPQPPAAEMLMLLGGKDEQAPAVKAQDYAGRLNKSGGKVEHVLYPELSHSFDSVLPAARGDTTTSLGASDIRVEDDGYMTETKTGLRDDKGWADFLTKAREALGKKVPSGGNGPLPRDVAVGSVIGFWKKTFKL
jgi:dienelactone hydrolase